MREERTAFLCEFDDTFHVGIRARDEAFGVGNAPHMLVERDEEFGLVERFPKTDVDFRVLAYKPTEHKTEAFASRRFVFGYAFGWQESNEGIEIVGFRIEL